MLKLKEYLSKSKLRSASILLILMLFSWYCFFGYKYGFVYTVGESMEPTYMDGEMVIVQNVRNLGRDWEPSRWDVIIILDRKEKEKLSKRVIGLAGDRIKIKEGLIYVNDKEAGGTYGKGKVTMQLVDENDNDLYFWGTNEKVTRNVEEAELTVPKGYVWIIGDNRPVSWYGLLPVKDVKALVIF